VVSAGGNQPNSYVQVLPQTDQHGLSTPIIYPSYDIPETVRTADVNQDGLDDVVVVHGGFTNVGVYLQQFDGTLADEQLFGIPYATDYQPQGMEVADVNSDQLPDFVFADYNSGLVVLRQSEPILGEGSPLWVRDASPADFAENVATGVSPTVRFSLPLDQTTINQGTVKLTNAQTGAIVSSSVNYDSGTDTATVHPAAPLPAGQPFAVTVDGVQDDDGDSLDVPFSFRFTTAGLDTTPPDTSITAGPTGTVASRKADFAFDAAGETVDGFECSLDGSAFRVCTSPKHYASLADGSHTF